MCNQIRAWVLDNLFFFDDKKLSPTATATLVQISFIANLKWTFHYLQMFAVISTIKETLPTATVCSTDFILTPSLSTLSMKWLSERWILALTWYNKLKMSHYKSTTSSLASPLLPSAQHRAKRARIKLLCLKLKAKKTQFAAKWHQSRVSPGPLASTLSGTGFLTCWSFVQSAGLTLDSMQRRNINQSFDLLLPQIGSNESAPAKLQWGSKDK